MNLIEKELENIILTTPNEILQQKGLPIFGTKRTQVDLGPYGRADLITINKQYDEGHLGNFKPTLIITIYELKQRYLDIHTIAQVSSYLKGIKTYIEHNNKFKNFEVQYFIVLIGHSIKQNMNFYFMNNLFVNADIYKYDFSIDGLNFEYVDTNLIYNIKK